MAVREISRAPALLAEAERSLPSLLEAATDPAGHIGVARAISAKFAIFPQPDRSEAQWADFWRDYVDVLGHLSESAIEAGMRQWVRSPDTEFLPKPGKLLKLATTTPNAAATAYERAKYAVEESKARRPIENPVAVPKVEPKQYAEPTAAEKANVRRMLREFQAQNDELKESRKPPRKEGYGHPPAVDDAGLTEAMREARYRQAERYG